MLASEKKEDSAQLASDRSVHTHALRWEYIYTSKQSRIVGGDPVCLCAVHGKWMDGLGARFPGDDGERDRERAHCAWHACVRAG